VTSMYIYLCDFDRCDSFVFLLYGDVITFVVCLGQILMCCPHIFSRDDDMGDDGV